MTPSELAREFAAWLRQLRPYPPAIRRDDLARELQALRQQTIDRLQPVADKIHGSRADLSDPAVRYAVATESEMDLKRVTRADGVDAWVGPRRPQALLLPSERSCLTLLSILDAINEHGITDDLGARLVDVVALTDPIHDVVAEKHRNLRKRDITADEEEAWRREFWSFKERRPKATDLEAAKHIKKALGSDRSVRTICDRISVFKRAGQQK